MTPSSYGPFDVELSGIQRDQIRDLLRKARTLGIASSFGADLQAIFRNLELSPRAWGDPLFSLDGLQLTMYRGIHAKIAVHYAVHDRLPTIFVARIDLILSHPLANP